MCTPAINKLKLQISALLGYPPARETATNNNCNKPRHTIVRG